MAAGNTVRLKICSWQILSTFDEDHERLAIIIAALKLWPRRNSEVSRRFVMVKQPPDLDDQPNLWSEIACFSGFCTGANLEPNSIGPQAG